MNKQVNEITLERLHWQSSKFHFFDNLLRGHAAGGGSKRGTVDVSPTSWSNYFHFHALFFSKTMPNNRFLPQARGLAPPVPYGNRSATAGQLYLNLPGAVVPLGSWMRLSQCVFVLHLTEF